ncbi:maleylpyruvate isomerase family mycothiol-dependent enzyme [Candidatus Poriferisodalis sp.]|uniref:maleylpyruvate isomerase family mycothiol-dependent enzyme n=1 Tax=Candidatus Poriferisodalis sp. TaxID=3101277 RepID=UPI003B02E8C8
MDATAYAEFRGAEGARLNEIAADADRSPDMWASGVPSCGDWTLEALIAHCATVWTFVRSSVTAGTRVDPAAVARPPGSVSQWHADAFSALTDLMTGRPSDAEAWTWDPENQSMSFWWRRMAHESTMHRWDAEAALGITPAPIAPGLAVDGIDELFDVYVRLRRPDGFAGDGETVHLHATDAHGEWVITRTPDGMQVERTHAKSDVAARGPAQDLLLFVWGRIGPERLETFGRTDLLDEWQRDVRF